MKAFLLQHVHTLENDSEDTKVIGLYSSEENARNAILRIAALPGFSEPTGQFHVDPYELDQDHWTEGFVTVP